MRSSSRSSKGAEKQSSEGTRADRVGERISRLTCDRGKGATRGLRARMLGELPIEVTKMPKSHGCSGKLHPLQMCAYVIITLQATGFYTLIVTVMPGQAKPVAAALYSFGLLGLAVTGGLSTFIDPTDYVVVAERRAKATQQPFDKTPYKQICTICQTHVLEESKHCGQCDRCVDGFDHHCKWLNNCVGSRNYRYFALLIGFLELLAGLQTGFSSYVLHCFSDPGFPESTAKALGLGSAALYVTLVALQMIVSLVLFVVIGQLITLHIWLRANHLTTYEYIINRRESRQKRVVPEKEDATTNQDVSVLKDSKHASKDSSTQILEEPEAELSLTRRKWRRAEVLPAETLSRLASG